MNNTFVGIILFIAGFGLGGLLIWLMKRTEIRNMTRGSEAMKNAFGELSRTVMNQNTETFLKLAKDQFSNLLKSSDNQLSEKKKLIDSGIDDMKNYLKNLGNQTTELKGQLEQSQEGIKGLSETTSQLRQILSSSQKRGQWGERMVEDICNFIGLEKGINYTQQTYEGTDRPDYTFILPKKMRVNMDVKFPLEHYESYLETEDESEKKQFLKDVRDHVKKLASRTYIDTDGGTVDYVLMFIPNESIYTFINSEDKGIIDDSLQKKIVLCSPVTLYAILSLIRQSVESFSIEAKAGEMQKMMMEFSIQWEKFIDKMDSMGKSLDTAQSRFSELAGARRNKLEKPVNKILDLKLNKSAELEGVDE